MTLVEGLLIVIALSLNIIQVAEYEGSNIHKIKARNLMLVCLIFLLGQMISMGIGYSLTLIPFFRREISADVKAMCYVIAAVIFFAIAGYLVYKTCRKRDIIERVRELRYKRIALEAITVAVLTLAAGFGCGLLKLNPLHAFLSIAFITIAAVIIGIYMGYYQGQRFCRALFGISSIVFCLTGIELLVRYF